MHFQRFRLRVPSTVIYVSHGIAPPDTIPGRKLREPARSRQGRDQSRAQRSLADIELYSRDVTITEPLARSKWGGGASSRFTANAASVKKTDSSLRLVRLLPT